MQLPDAAPRTRRPSARAGRRWSGRARRLARLLRILAAVIREPGVRPDELARLIGASQRTVFRDLTRLRRLGYAVVFSDGYRLQESLSLEGGDAGGPRRLADAYAEEIRLVRAEAPDELATRVENEVDALAPAALAELFAEAVERRLPARS
ncbi:MAG: HTH domain-containing protein [Candidatus Dormibacteraeota bacterium]|nr:HTH domain-containing protein [Candidatus Dormibacteraeota bacterium]